MKNIYRTSFLIFTIFIISGCATRELTAGGSNVSLYSQAPKSCKFLGAISNPNVHENLDLRENEEKDHINYIKNESARLGGNAVVISSLIRTKVKRYYVRSSNYFMMESHAITAHAYYCPGTKM